MAFVAYIKGMEYLGTITPEEAIRLKNEDPTIKIRCCGRDVDGNLCCAEVVPVRKSNQVDGVTKAAYFRGVTAHNAGCEHCKAGKTQKVMKLSNNLALVSVDKIYRDLIKGGVVHPVAPPPGPPDGGQPEIPPDDNDDEREPVESLITAKNLLRLFKVLKNNSLEAETGDYLLRRDILVDDQVYHEYRNGKPLEGVKIVIAERCQNASLAQKLNDMVKGRRIVLQEPYYGDEKNRIYYQLVFDTGKNGFTKKEMKTILDDFYADKQKYTLWIVLGDWTRVITDDGFIVYRCMIYSYGQFKKMSKVEKEQENYLEMRRRRRRKA